MARSQGSWNKKEIAQKKEKKRKEKVLKKLDRKSGGRDGNNLDEMIAYVDENGNISDTPPDPSLKRVITLEEIEIGVPKREPDDPADLIRKGVISFFNSSKGFGFIRDLETQASVFLHINELESPVQEGDKVVFEMGMGKKGPMAVKVKRMG